MVLCYFIDSHILQFSVNQKPPLFFIHFYYLSYDKKVVGKPFSVSLIILHIDYYFQPSLKGPCHRSPYLRSVCLEPGYQSGMRRRYKSESRVGVRETIFKPLSHNDISESKAVSALLG